MIKSARITGKVEYREGDGANITIRPGPCEIDETAMDATISWTALRLGQGNSDRWHEGHLRPQAVSAMHRSSLRACQG